MDINAFVARLDAMPYDAVPDHEADFEDACALLQQHETYADWAYHHGHLRADFLVLEARVHEAYAMFTSGTRRELSIEECKCQLVKAYEIFRLRLGSVRRYRQELEADAIFVKCMALAEKVPGGMALLRDFTLDKTETMLEKMQTWSELLRGE